ncbi:unnamed protein product, partial [Arabidopsis thaliana]
TAPLNKKSEVNVLRISRGVIPPTVLTLGSAWWSNRTATMSGETISAAMCKGVLSHAEIMVVVVRH